MWWCGAMESSVDIQNFFQMWPQRYKKLWVACCFDVGNSGSGGVGCSGLLAK